MDHIGCDLNHLDAKTYWTCVYLNLFVNYVWILSCDLSIIWVHRYAELVYIWIFWVVDSECWLWIWTCPVNMSLIWMFTFLLYLCVNLLVCLLWGIKPRSLIKVMLCPIYVFPSNHIIYIYIITIIVYFIETYIYIIKTSHMLLTYESKCLTEVGKENPGCFWLIGKENPGDCVQKLAKILGTNLIITHSFLFWAITR